MTTGCRYPECRCSGPCAAAQRQKAGKEAGPEGRDISQEDWATFRREAPEATQNLLKRLAGRRKRAGL